MVPTGASPTETKVFVDKRTKVKLTDQSFIVFRVSVDPFEY